MKLLIAVSGLIGAAALVLSGGLLQASPPALVTYWASGRLRTRIEQVDGVKQGPATTWYADGGVESKGRYENGLRQGAWSFYRPDGSLDLEKCGTYEAGVRTEPPACAERS